MGYDLEQVKWGFADEVAAQLHSNNARFWAFEPHLPRVVNTDRGSQSFFGFYGINAVSHLVDLADGKFEAIQQALLAVKAEQTACAALVVFWDNARTHKSLETWGWERRIFFVPLPTYSPEWSATAAEPHWAGLEISQAVAQPNAVCQRTYRLEWLISSGLYSSERPTQFYNKLVGDVPKRASLVSFYF